MIGRLVRHTLRQVISDPKFADKRFVDRITLSCRAGSGGAGSSSFTLNKNTKTPSGGNGGQGGSVILQSNRGLFDLSKIRKTKILAQEGGQGGSRGQTGKNGGDHFVQVPIGTQVFKIISESQQLKVHQFTRGNEKIVIARGGLGGHGNKQKSRLPASQGQLVRCELILKLIADVGIIGLPNIGKSTLLATLTQAKPKIANYPFTTLDPVVGQLEFVDGKGITISDLPGIIEGSNQNRGLGLKFLKHIEKNKVFLIMLQLGGEHSLQQQLSTLLLELYTYNPEFKSRSTLVAVNKADLQETQKYETFRAQSPFQTFLISARKGLGLEPLVKRLREIVLP